MLLRWCSGATLVLWRYSGDLTILWCCYSGALVLLWCCSSAYLVLLWRYSGALAVLWCSEAAKVMLLRNANASKCNYFALTRETRNAANIQATLRRTQPAASERTSDSPLRSVVSPCQKHNKKLTNEQSSKVMAYHNTRSFVDDDDHLARNAPYPQTNKRIKQFNPFWK